ncbi:CvpA family protein [Vagococcus elongatus]|uniref:Colicin V production protein CvpA n=1 Tax=Vagococcus elongatus TaxID=180344 RepID=A0A430AMK9_9ENTE|nr:CvpA family protein [Vagococcus elongatus]RSU09193.1 colicin V production protein CvpA [Vagococcus elongatus]
MLSIVILITLVFAVYTGARRGIILQGIYTIGYLISFFVAQKFFIKFVDILELIVPYPQASPDSQLVFFEGEMLFDLDRYFYGGVSFILCLVIGWVIVRFLGIFLYELNFTPVKKEVHLIGGGALSFFVAIVALCILLTLLAMVPVDFVQNLFRDSGLARGIVKNTPYFSKKILELWTGVPL